MSNLHIKPHYKTIYFFRVVLSIWYWSCLFISLSSILNSISDTHSPPGLVQLFNNNVSFSYYNSQGAKTTHAVYGDDYKWGFVTWFSLYCPCDCRCVADWVLWRRKKRLCPDEMFVTPKPSCNNYHWKNLYLFGIYSDYCLCSLKTLQLNDNMGAYVESFYDKKVNSHLMFILTFI